MRITGGTLAGRRAACPAGRIRPAMDMMRESVFAVLGPINEKYFLDLFSGSGIIALEAASRGAFPVEAVEGGSEKRKTLLANLAIAERPIRCRFMPVELYIKRSKCPPFDFIFCDPPFPYAFKKELLCNIASSSLVHEGSLIMLHYPSEEKLNFGSGEKLVLADRRRYGRSTVDFLNVDFSNNGL